jgi:hypothetical protein
MRVAEKFRIAPRKLASGVLGIEIEVEGRKLPRRITGWNTDYDGSLVGESYEYVLEKPMSLADAMGAVDNVCKAYDDAGSTVKDSVRCGVHVHVNAQRLSIPQLYNFMTLYSMFEGVLLAYCGPYRDGNLFCLPLNKSPLLLNALRYAAQNKEFGMLCSDEYRYCAMNVKALGQYGSLEFRALRGGSDLTRVKSWASLLLHLSEVACKYDNPGEIFSEASKLGSTQFFLNTVGDFAEMFNGISNIKRRLQRGVRAAAPLAYACDWDIYNYVEVDPYEDFC